MTKKILLILCMFMLVFVSGCTLANTSETNQEIEEDVQKEEIKREIIDSLEYKLGDNLPTILLDEQFVNIELTSEDKDSDIEAGFTTLDGRLMILISRYARNDYTLEDAPDMLINAYYSEEDLVGMIFDNWKGNNCKYGYYMAYDDNSYDYPYYIQTYIFEDGEDFVEVDYWHTIENINVDDVMTFDIPYALMEKVEPSEEEINNGAFLRYKSLDDEITDICFYKRKADEKNYEKLLEQYKKEYNVIESEEYLYEDDGEEFNNFYIKYESNKEGRTVTNYELITYLSGSYYSVNFETNSLYRAISIPSIVYSINVK